MKEGEGFAARLGIGSHPFTETDISLLGLGNQNTKART